MELAIRLHSLLNIITNTVIVWQDRQESGLCLALGNLIWVIGGGYRTRVEEVLFYLCNFWLLKLYFSRNMLWFFEEKKLQLKKGAVIQPSFNSLSCDC